MELTREQIEARKIWWQAHFKPNGSHLSEEVEFWRSEIALCDAALRGLESPEAIVRAALEEARKIAGDSAEMERQAKAAHHRQSPHPYNMTDFGFNLDVVRYSQSCETRIRALQSPEGVAGILKVVKHV